MFTVFGCQYDIAWEDRDANFARIRALLAEEEIPAGSLIVLPEMYATGFSMNVPVTAEPDEAPALEFMKALAAERNCVVMGGFATHSETRPEFGRNELRAVGPGGGELVRYQKIRTFRYTREFDHYERGRDVVGFEWGGMKVCPLICYDLRFPELFRRGVAEQEAEVFIVIASWPGVRVSHWLALLRARAIENLAYVIGINRSGTDPNHVYPGRSVVFDPHGELIADAGEGEGVLKAAIDPAVVRDWRAEFPALLDLEA
ncbi:MAG: carbon-nitrogen family hydrolase [Verrucomicrobiae bacterium]|nr:carbon-nitrogen family hydrolase [Verrucomicrobiae bacterium]